MILCICIVEDTKMGIWMNAYTYHMNERWMVIHVSNTVDIKRKEGEREIYLYLSLSLSIRGSWEIVEG